MFSTINEQLDFYIYIYKNIQLQAEFIYYNYKIIINILILKKKTRPKICPCDFMPIYEAYSFLQHQAEILP